MTQELHLQNLNLQPGTRVRVKGFVRNEAKTFRINLGKDELNIGLHFNPRFNFHGDHNVIVYNSKTKGKWDEEIRDSAFPFKELHTVEVNFEFDKNKFKVWLHDGHGFSFPNRLELQKIDFVAVYGDFHVRKVEFE